MKGENYAEPFPGYSLLGVRISALNMESATEQVLKAAKAGTKGYVCVTGVHGVIESTKDPELRRILNSAFLVTPDGMPTVWMGKLRGQKHMARVYGPELMEKVCAATANEPLTHYLYGGNTGVADLLKQKLEARFPGIRIAGTFCPPFRPLTTEEETNLFQEIQTLKPDFFWVGLSTPKQEKFMDQYLSRLHTTIMLGVGAAFDFHAGKVKQAPHWIQQAGLEWFYRLCMEPKRLWKRYISIVPRFLLLAALEQVGLRRSPPAPYTSQTSRK